MDESNVFEIVVDGVKNVSTLAGKIIDLAKGNSEIEDEAHMLSDLTRTILGNSITMMQLESHLREKARMLEEKLREMENWEEEKERYVLRNTGAYHAFAYVLKESSQTPGTVCWLCTTCFEKRKKRILQPEVTGRVLRCSECGLTTSY